MEFLGLSDEEVDYILEKEDQILVYDSSKQDFSFLGAGYCGLCQK